MIESSKAHRRVDYILLLDWLDKVRIGLWLAYHFVQNNPTGIEPTFHIKTRMRRKDRLVAVYPIEGDSKGLNTYGAESLLFHRSPSCFSLRINNLLLVNMSADFLISARCGFPFPRVRQLTLDKEHGFTMAVSDFVQHSRIRHPILRKPLHKPSVLLMQPVLQVPLDELERSGYSIDSAYIQAHSVDGRAGILLRQFADRVHSIENLGESIEFDRIVGRDCWPLYDLIAQVYEHQNELQSQYQLASKDARRLRRFTRLVKLLMRANTATASYLRSQPPIAT